MAQCKLNVPFLPFTLTEVLRNKKVCRDMFGILVTKTVHSPAIQKWQNNLLLPEIGQRPDMVYLPPRGNFVDHDFLEASCLASFLQHVSPLAMEALPSNSPLHMLPKDINLTLKEQKLEFM